jgi:hypothetical protein
MTKFQFKAKGFDINELIKTLSIAHDEIKDFDSKVENCCLGTARQRQQIGDPFYYLAEKIQDVINDLYELNDENKLGKEYELDDETSAA